MFQYWLIPLKRLAQDNQADEVAQAAFHAVEFSENLIDTGAVTDLQLAADGVGHQFLGEATGELLMPPAPHAADRAA